MLWQGKVVSFEVTFEESSDAETLLAVAVGPWFKIWGTVD